MPGGLERPREMMPAPWNPVVLRLRAVSLSSFPFLAALYL
jgi:hypothetical protein